MSGLASKQQSLKIFEKLKAKPANKVGSLVPPTPPPRFLVGLTQHANRPAPSRSASTAARRTRLGPRSPLESTFAWTALPITATSVSTSPSFGLPISTVCNAPFPSVYADARTGGVANPLAEWQWDQLRIMKVGGNESATKFFQSNGGSAALNSKDPKTKYTSAVATKYKEELKKRAARDAKEYGVQPARIAAPPAALTRGVSPLPGTPKRWSSPKLLKAARAATLRPRRRMTSSPRGAGPP